MEQNNDHAKNTEKFIRMTTQPVEKLIAKLAVPTIISMLVTSFYNLADTFFVRQLENDSMVAAVGVVLPLMTLIQAFGFFCGHGSGNYISRAYGKQDYKDAETMAATGFCYAVLFGLIIGVLGLVFIDPLALLLGAKTEATIRSTIDYMRYILYATPFMTGAIVMNNQLRMQGNAFFAMIGLTSGAIVNIVLDPILIYSAGDTLAGGSVTMPFGAGMGVGGAALATAVSQILSFFILFIGVTKSDNIKIHLKNFSPRLYYIKNIVRGGLPSLGRQGVSSVAVACLNHAVGIYVQDSIMIDAVQAAMTGVSKIMNFLTSALTGFGQGFQPVCGFNYGAKMYDRVKKSFWFAIKLGTGIMLALSLAGIFFAPQLIKFFRDDPEVIKVGAFMLRAQSLTYPLMPIATIGSMFLQTLGKATRASLLAVARQGMFLIPALLLMTKLFDLVGFQISQPVADLLAFALGVFFIVGVFREMDRFSQEAKRV